MGPTASGKEAQLCQRTVSRIPKMCGRKKPTARPHSPEKIKIRTETRKNTPFRIMMYNFEPPVEIQAALSICALFSFCGAFGAKCSRRI